MKRKLRYIYKRQYGGRLIIIDTSTDEKMAICMKWENVKLICLALNKYCVNVVENNENK
jgi:hypothetical protein